MLCRSLCWEAKKEQLKLSGVHEASSKNKTQGKKFRDDANVALDVLGLLRTTRELELNQNQNEAETRYGTSKWEVCDQLQSSCSAVKMLLAEKRDLNC